MRHEHHPGGHRPPYGPPPHRGRRPFDYGDLRLLVLSMVAEQPRHGYELIKAIEERTGGGYSPSPGVIYPTLAWLEDMGYATASADGGRRRYAITEEGRAFLAANRTALEAVAERAGRGEGGRQPAPEAVASAMHALKHALRRRFAAPPADPATITSIAAAIRAAAETVEQTMTDMSAEAGETVREVADVPTGHAQRYLGQLCKHFAHKIPVDFDATSGTIRFEAGVCRVRADAATLTLDLQAVPDKIEQLKDVVVRHLVRFAFREELPIAWKAA
ncbi:MAG: DUF2218 domain-containing protein [Amaricoccus sp.]